MGFKTHKNYRIILYVHTLMIVLFGAAVAVWGMFWMLPSGGLGESYGAIHAAVQGIRKVLFWKVMIIYTFVSIVIFLGIVLLHLVYSHRITGPVYRFALEAARIAQGNLNGNIKLRKKDNLTDVADLMNDIASRYRDCTNALKDQLALLETRLETASELIRQDKDGTAIKQTAKEITTIVKNIESSLSEIRA